MTRQELIEKLKDLSNTNDPELAHVEADNALLDYINDPEITEAFKVVPKWYA